MASNRSVTHSADAPDPAPPLTASLVVNAGRNEDGDCQW